MPYDCLANQFLQAQHSFGVCPRAAQQAHLLSYIFRLKSVQKY